MRWKTIKGITHSPCSVSISFGRAGDLRYPGIPGTRPFSRYCWLPPAAAGKLAGDKISRDFNGFGMFVKFLRLFGTVFNDRRAIKRRIDIEVSMGDFAAGGRDVLFFGVWCKFFYTSLSRWV